MSTTKWANGLSQELATQKRYSALLERRIANPRFDPTTDPEYIAQQAQKDKDASTTKIRSEMSLDSANKKYGAEEVTKFVTKYKEKFGDDQATRMRILESESPVEAAIEMVVMADFFEEYGEDPAKIIETITRKALADATPKLRVEERKRILAEIKKTGKVSSGLRSIRGEETKDASKDTPAGGDKPLDTLFGQ